MHEQEQILRKMGFPLIAGIDEAGRGPLAGPVVAAAVMFDGRFDHPQINDSKQLSPLQREMLYTQIIHNAVSWSVSIIPPKKIDDMGILNATKLAMRQAALKLNPVPDFLLIDAVAVNVTNIPQKAIIKADETIFCVAAASILAKVTRDRLMAKYHQKYPEYGFSEHMGYGTKIHLKAIKKHGASPIHRLSFSPFK